jgi:hypothetical protein
MVFYEILHLRMDEGICRIILYSLRRVPSSAIPQDRSSARGSSECEQTTT